MEKKDARLFRHGFESVEPGWNIVEHEVLESRRQLRQKVNELITLCNASSLTTSEMQHYLLLGAATFGKQFAAQLVRSLHSDDIQKRQHIVWLLTLLNDQEIIPLLQRMSHNEQLSRAMRLSASLALAGMGATTEITSRQEKVRHYASS